MKFIIRAMCITALLTCSSWAQQVSLDRVAVIVDQGVILESEIQAVIEEVKRNAQQEDQSLPADRVLRTQAIERLILKNLQMQRAERMGIQVSDPQLEQTVANIAQNQGVTVAQLRQELSRQGISYDDYREDVREELIVGEVRRANVRRRIYITEQEVDSLVQVMNEQGAEQAEYHLGHILIGLPSEPDEEAVEEARQRAGKVLSLLQEEDSDFARLAITSSSGSNALEGGDMGWLNINSMPTLFAEAVQEHEKGDLIGPIRSGAGFHILKIKDTRGIEKVTVEEVNSRHILIKPSIILSEEKAKQRLEKFRQQVIDGDADFAELAKEHSEDPGSALKGGNLGWADPSMYVPAFQKALSNLEPGEYSQPIRSTHGWHLIQLQDRRFDDATEKRKEEKAQQLIYSRKFKEESETWLREMRDAAYIEVL